MPESKSGALPLGYAPTRRAVDHITTAVRAINASPVDAATAPSRLKAITRSRWANTAKSPPCTEAAGDCHVIEDRPAARGAGAQRAGAGSRLAEGHPDHRAVPAR